MTSILQSGRVVVAMAIAAVGVVPSRAVAQAVTVRYADLRPNERVHVTSSDGALAVREGALFLRAGMDTLFIQRRLMTESWPVPLHELKDLQVVRGRKTRPIAASVGLLLGASAGAVVGAISCASTCAYPAWGRRARFGAIAGGAIGFKLGFGPHDRWVPVVLPIRGGR
jgi:hypothetical protein